MSEKMFDSAARGAAAAAQENLISEPKTCVNIEGHRKDKKDAKNSTQFVARKLNWTAWNR